jgi:hypothetical protein
MQLKTVKIMDSIYTKSVIVKSRVSANSTVQSKIF